jgi:hypothetical protein
MQNKLASAYLQHQVVYFLLLAADWTGLLPWTVDDVS